MWKISDEGLPSQANFFASTFAKATADLQAELARRSDKILGRWTQERPRFYLRR